MAVATASTAGPRQPEAEGSATTMFTRPSMTAPGSPSANSCLEEWAYGRLYHSTAERRRAFARWLRSYNHRRPHTALDGLTPMAVLVNNASGKHT